MTTKVIIVANGECYPAHILKVAKTAIGNVVEVDQMVLSGDTFETWVGTDHILTITEEYWPNGIAPVPVTSSEPAHAPADVPDEDIATGEEAAPVAEMLPWDGSPLTPAEPFEPSQI